MGIALPEPFRSSNRVPWGCRGRGCTHSVPRGARGDPRRERIQGFPRPGVGRGRSSLRNGPFRRTPVKAAGANGSGHDARGDCEGGELRPPGGDPAALSMAEGRRSPRTWRASRPVQRGCHRPSRAACRGVYWSRGLRREGKAATASSAFTRFGRPPVTAGHWHQEGRVSYRSVVVRTAEVPMSS